MTERQFNKETWLIWCATSLGLIGYGFLLIHSPLTFVCGGTANALAIVYNGRRHDLAQMTLFLLYGVLAVIGLVLWTRR